MDRAYYKWFSKALQKDMELLVFGHGGASVIFFPTRSARFYDYENWKIIEALQHKINQGYLQVYCVDSVDSESFYCHSCNPADRISRHLQYEAYILDEVLALIHQVNPGSGLVSAGCSMGAYHAVNIAFKHPGTFTKVLGMSGRYDLTLNLGDFYDLFDGYRDETIYFNTPCQFVSNLHDEHDLQLLRKTEIILAVGQTDIFLHNNKDFGRILWDKQISNSLYIWNEEAHKPKYWREMVNLYL